MGHACVKNETGHSNFQFLNSPILFDTFALFKPGNFVIPHLSKE